MNMKNIYRTVLAISLIAMINIPQMVFAGNKDRSGQSAAAHLLINPWAGTRGWGGVGVSSTKGIQAMYTNVAGMAFTRKTEIAYTNTLYYVNSDMMFNGLGIVQSLGKDGFAGNIGVNVNILTNGDIPRTTVDQPDGGLGTYKFNALNLGLSYARSFSDAVHAGATIKIINESTSNVSGTGFAIDLGVQYVAGRNDQFQLGVVMKNIGLPMKYKGNGMNIRGEGNKDRLDVLRSLLIPSEAAEMPSLLALGLSYDFLFGKKASAETSSTGTTGKQRISRADAMHRITVAGAFTAFAYSRDQFSLGVEYSLMDYFQVRAGYVFEGGMYTSKTTTNNFGPNVGVSLLTPLSKKSVNPHSRLAIDYAYSFTEEYKGSHSIGVHLIL